MSDIFISYASEDRDQAHKLASALESLGWSVWWDRDIVTGQAYDQVIERELNGAKSVVVLWSSHSVASEWVKNEAAAAAERGVLLPVLIERVTLPLEFRRKQTADFIGWDGDPAHSGFQALCRGVSATIGGVAPNRLTIAQRPSMRWNRRWTLAAVAMGLALLAGYFVGRWRRETPEPALVETVPQAGINASSARLEPGRSSAQGEPATPAPTSTTVEPADLVAGKYFGDVIADSKGSSRSDVLLTITKLDKWKVRITSDYPRLGTVDVTLTRAGGKIVNAGGNAVFLMDPNVRPLKLEYNPNGEVVYAGHKQ